MVPQLSKICHCYRRERDYQDRVILRMRTWKCVRQNNALIGPSMVRALGTYWIPNGGFIKGILRGVRCTKSLRVLFLHRRPPSWTTLVLYSRAVFIFNEPALILTTAKIFPSYLTPSTYRYPEPGPYTETT
jgi:hypothetical protein